MSSSTSELLLAFFAGLEREQPCDESCDHTCQDSIIQTIDQVAARAPKDTARCGWIWRRFGGAARRLDVAVMLAELAKRGLRQVLSEGGPTLFARCSIDAGDAPESRSVLARRRGAWYFITYSSQTVRSCCGTCGCGRKSAGEESSALSEGARSCPCRRADDRVWCDRARIRISAASRDIERRSRTGARRRRVQEWPVESSDVQHRRSQGTANTIQIKRTYDSSARSIDDSADDCKVAHAARLCVQHCERPLATTPARRRRGTPAGLGRQMQQCVPRTSRTRAPGIP
jgi:hypothetical protein